jgi:hypothetical protein
VVAAEIGRFFVDDGSGWRELGDSMYTLRVLTIRPTEHGFLWGGELGVLGEYRHDSGFCMPQTLHPHDVWNVNEAGGRIYLVNRGDDGIADLTVVRR